MKLHALWQMTLFNNFHFSFQWYCFFISYQGIFHCLKATVLHRSFCFYCLTNKENDASNLLNILKYIHSSVLRYNSNIYIYIYIYNAVMNISLIIFTFSECTNDDSLTTTLMFPNDMVDVNTGQYNWSQMFTVPDCETVVNFKALYPPGSVNQDGILSIQISSKLQLCIL